MIYWALKWLISKVNGQKASLLNLDSSSANYFTVPLQSYSLHCFLLSHWHRSDQRGSHMLHLMPCRSTLLCKQVLCCCKSSFASSQTSCTCILSAWEGLQVSVLLWLSVVQEAPHPLSVHDPPVIQDPA